jgi:hypothetical protein
MQLIFSAEVSLFFSMIPDHINTFIPSWYRFENSIMVENGLLCSQPIMNSIFSLSSSCSMTESHLQHLIIYSMVQEPYQSFRSCKLPWQVQFSGFLRQLMYDKAVVHPAGRFGLYVARCYFENILKCCTIICSLQL